MALIVNANLSDRVTEYITNKIIKMEYKPGDRIVESKIAKELKISHSPIREALRLLERSQLVEHIPRKGVYVTELVESNIESLFEIMTELLVLVGKKTIKMADDDDIKQITSIVERALSAAKLNANEGYYNNVIAFGVFCLSVCKDTLLEQIIFELLPSIQRILYLSFTAHEDNLSEGALLLVKGATAISERAVDQTEILLRKWLSLEMVNAINGLKAGHLLRH
jgi:DNA-binding GntR family transcriptional regulator